MSLVKQVTTTVTTFGLATLILFTWQYAEVSSLKREYQKLSLQLDEVGQSSNRGEHIVPPPRNSVNSLLNVSSGRTDFENFMSSLEEGLINQNMLTVMKVLIPVTQLKKDEIDGMMDRLADYNGNPNLKSFTTQALISLTQKNDPAIALQQAMKAGAMHNTLWGREGRIGNCAQNRKK